MADTTFVNGTTVIDATWLNDINAIAYKTTYSISLAGLTMHGNVLPNATNTRDLGSSTFRWSNVFTQGLDVAGTSTLAAINAAGTSTLAAINASGRLTLTGADSQIIIAPASGSGAIDIKSFSSAGNAALNFFSSAPSTGVRWQIIKNNVAEGPGNVGGDFNINRYDNTGAFLGTPFTIARASGEASIAASAGSPLTLIGTNAGGGSYLRLANTAGSVGSASIISLDPGNNGVLTRDFTIRATNNGSNQITTGFWTSNGSTPFESFRLDNTGNALLVNAAGGLGYGTGAGGTVNQATDKTTAVTLNKSCGTINMAATSLAAGARVVFIFNNSFIQQNDNLLVSVSGIGVGNVYNVNVAQINAGNAVLALTNTSAGALATNVILNFTVFKGAVT